MCCICLLPHQQCVGDVALDRGCVLHDDLPDICCAEYDAEDGPY